MFLVARARRLPLPARQARVGALVHSWLGVSRSRSRTSPPPPAGCSPRSGRQPWIVQGLLKTADAHSPSVSAATIATSLGVFALLYVVLGVVDVVLMRRYARVDPPEAGGERDESRSRAGGLTDGRSRSSGSASSWSSGRGYFVLEGFDFGVGMLLPFVSRATRSDRRGDAADDRAASGTATRSGSSSPAARRSPPSRPGTRRCSPASTSCSCSSSCCLIVRVCRSSGARRARRPALARRAGAGRTRSASFGAPLLWGVGARQPRSTASRSTPTATSAGTFWTSSTPYTVVAGRRRRRCCSRCTARRSSRCGRRASCATGRARGAAASRSRPRSSSPRSSSGRSQVAIDRNDKELVPPVLSRPLIGAAALALAVVFALRGRNGWAFAMTALARSSLVATLFIAPLSARDRLGPRLRQQPHGRRAPRRRTTRSAS